MKCQLRHGEGRLIEFTDGSSTYKMGECIKEECAWWIPETKQCSIKAIAVALNKIASKPRSEPR